MFLRISEHSVIYLRSFQAGRTIISTPVVDTDRGYIGSDAVYAIATHHGNVLWANNPEINAALGSLAMEGEVWYIACLNVIECA